jgi:hypothetical protein
LVNVLSQYQFQEEPTSPLSDKFVVIFQELLKASERPDGLENNLMITCYEGMNILLKHAAQDCLLHFTALIPFFIQAVERSFSPKVSDETQANLHSFIPALLQTIVERLETAIIPYANSIFECLVRIFDYRKAVTDEALMGISALISEDNPDSQKYFLHLKPYLLEALKKYDDTNLLIAALNCFGTCCDLLQEELYTHDQGQFCLQFMEILFSTLMVSDDFPTQCSSGV